MAETRSFYLDYVPKTIDGCDVTNVYITPGSPRTLVKYNGDPWRAGSQTKDLLSADTSDSAEIIVYAHEGSELKISNCKTIKLKEVKLKSLCIDYVGELVNEGGSEVGKLLVNNTLVHL